MEITSGNQRLLRGVHYAEQSWIPICEQNARALREGLKDGRYEGRHSDLLSDLTRDPALFLFCLKKRAQQESSKDTEKPESWFSPEELLGPASTPALIEILSSSLELVSTHRLAAASPEQGRSMQQAATSAAVSVALASKADLPETTSTATSFLRNLGLMLIAWNYPHIYKKVLASLEPDASLDQAFGLLLGFSPTLLGITLARSWSLSPEVLVAMGDKVAREIASPELLARGQRLEAICRTGEAFARAMHPENYPSADDDWREASTEIKRALGPQGLKVISKVVRDYLRAYTSAFPDSFKLPERLVQEPEHAAAEPTDFSQRNRYLSACPPAIKAALEEIYLQLRAHTVGRIPLEQLIHSVIPRAGFVRGCVYLFDPEHQCLRPRVSIGAVQINELSPVPCDSQVDRHALAEALTSGIPQELQSSCIDASPCDALAGVLGGAQKTGVLYLEAGQGMQDTSPQVRMGVFKALRQTMNDALRLN